MDEIRSFLDIPNLNINDLADIFQMSSYLNDKFASRLIGIERFKMIISNDKLKDCSIEALIDTCFMIKQSNIC